MKIRKPRFTAHHSNGQSSVTNGSWPLSRRNFLATLGAGTASLIGAAALGESKSSVSRRPPNIVLILTDDQGYADIGCFGGVDIETPELDRLAAEGMRFTDFYAAASVCTPSRAGLLTGCYPTRVSMGNIPREDNRGYSMVLFEDSDTGLNPSEITIAETLREEGYATACVGKWHLGHQPPFLPTRQGFDYYFGIPYSNDMKPAVLMRNEDILENETDQNILIERYTEEVQNFIRVNAQRPFFVYMAHNMPHVPLHVPERFRGKSKRGLYGDVLKSIDWSTGEILRTLRELGLDENTLVVFTSDNGPWLSYGEHGGLATPFRAGKGTTYEGGMRVPCIMRWPSRIPAGTVCREMISAMDLMPTFAGMTGCQVPDDRKIDGKDILPLMTAEEGSKSPHAALFYYFKDELHAVRSGEWKLKFETKLFHEDIYRPSDTPETVVPEALYNLRVDPGEQRNVLQDHPDIAKRLRELAQHVREDLGDDRLGVAGRSKRPPGTMSMDSQAPEPPEMQGVMQP